MDFLSTTVAKLKNGAEEASPPEPTTSRSRDTKDMTKRGHQQGGGAEEISREDLLHLTMKLQKRLKVTEASAAKSKAELASARKAAETLVKFVAAEVLDDPSSLDASQILYGGGPPNSSGAGETGGDSKKSDVSDVLSPEESLKETLLFVWEKRKLEIFADEKASGESRERESRAALERAVAARDEQSSRAQRAERELEDQRATHEEQIVYLRMKADQASADAGHTRAKLEKMEGASETSVMEVETLRADVKSFKDQIGSLKEALKEKDEVIALKGRTLSEHATLLREKDAQLTRQEAERAQLANLHAATTREIADLRKALDASKAAKLKRESKETKAFQKRHADVAVLAASACLDSAKLAVVSADLATTHAASALAKYLAEEDKLHAAAEHARRSSLARQIVVEKDARIKELNARVDDLEKDAAAGGHAHRRIVEIAQAQAQRDAAAHAEVRAHKIANIKLQRGLKKRDHDIAELTRQLADASFALRDTSSRVKRDNLDMEYVKNVVVRYLALPSGSSERASLVPVLATVLHFSDADVRQLAKANSPWHSYLVSYLGDSSSSATSGPTSAPVSGMIPPGGAFRNKPARASSFDRSHSPPPDFVRR